MLQVEQLDKLEQYTTPSTEGVTTDDGELGELSQKFYQAAVQVSVREMKTGGGKNNILFVTAGSLQFLYLLF